MQPVGIELVAQHPRLDDDVVEAEREQHPRRVVAHDVVHLPRQLLPLGAVGQRAGGDVEPVVLGQLEAREVGEARVGPVEQAEEAEALGVRVDVAQPPRLQLAQPRRLEQVGPLLLDELDVDADRGHVLLPQLVDLAVDRGRRRVHPDLQRRAVGQLAQAVAVAVAVAEAVEQRPRAGGVVGPPRGQRRVVAAHPRRHHLRRRHRLPLADDADVLVDVVRHAPSPAAARCAPACSRRRPGRPC